MIGKLVVARVSNYKLVGEVITELRTMDMVGIKIKHISSNELIDFLKATIETNDIYWVEKKKIIKKSSRPVKMKQQLSLEEQQPTTL